MTAAGETLMETDRTASRRAVTAEGLPAAIGLGFLLAIAVVLRLVPTVFVPSINWGDEIFQATEQAHRLIFGYGIVPWEFQLGARSWLLPGVVAGLIELSRPLGDGPAYYLPVIAVAFALLAVAPVYCTFQWCRRPFGLTGAFIAAVVVAAAPELVYFGSRVLFEVIAAHLLVIAVYLVEPGYPVASRRRLVAAGAVFGLACLLRVQLAPAAAVIVLWSAWGGWRGRLVPLLAGGALVMLLGGAVLDWLTIGYPFASLWRYVLYNIFYGVSSGFGTEPWYYYVLGELGLWGGGALFLLVVVGLGAWRMPLLLVAAAIILAEHSAIEHKEYRFIYPVMLLAMILAGIGLAQLAQWGEDMLRRRDIVRRGAAAVCAIVLLGYWSAVAVHVWSNPTMFALRGQLSLRIDAANLVKSLPEMCGLGLFGSDGRDWVGYGGYTYLHRPLPLYWPSDMAALALQAPAFNVLIYTTDPPPELGFKTARCFDYVCVAERAGGCTPHPMSAMPFPQSLVGMAPPKENFEAVPWLAQSSAAPAVSQAH